MSNPDGKAILAQCADELDIARAHLPDRVQPERVESDNDWLITLLLELRSRDVGADLRTRTDKAIAELQAAPPTDASGGVTDVYSFVGHSTHDDTGAADRARKPDHTDVGSVYEQAEAWETIVKMLDEIAPGWNHIEGQGTGTNLACHAIRKMLNARKPGYRQVTLEDAETALRRFDETCDAKTPLESAETLLRALRSINAAIKEG